jgi:hypothetical protein
MFGGFAFLMFWSAVIWVWLVDGPKIPLIFAALWFAVLFVVARLHASVNLVVPFTCVLGVLLLIIGKYKSML